MMVQPTTFDEWVRMTEERPVAKEPLFRGIVWADIVADIAAGVSPDIDRRPQHAKL